MSSAIIELQLGLGLQCGFAALWSLAFLGCYEVALDLVNAGFLGFLSGLNYAPQFDTQFLGLRIHYLSAHEAVESVAFYGLA